MNHAENFFNSLNDEQLGFYYTHEYNDKLEELLQRASQSSSFDFSIINKLLSKLDHITDKLDQLDERMKRIESRQDQTIGTSTAFADHKIVDTVNCPTPLNKNTNDLLEARFVNVISGIADPEAPPICICFNSFPYIPGKNLAIEWFDSLLEKLTDANIENRKEIAENIPIEIVLSVMKKFKESRELEYRGCLLVKVMLETSKSVCQNIVDSGILEYMKEIFLESWPHRKHKESTLIVIYVCLIYSGQNTTWNDFLKESYFELFLLPFSEPIFSQFNILAGYLLAIMLSIDDSQWNMQITKSELDHALNNYVSEWPLGNCDPFVATKLKLNMNLLTTGRISQQRYFAWLITNRLVLTPNSLDFFEKERLALEIEEILLVESADTEVKRFFRIALDITNRQ